MSNDLPKGFGNILDSHFHTIIDPKKYGPNNFSKLINYYWTIFFSIYSSILGVQQITSEFVSDFVDNIEQRIQDLYSTSIGKEIYQGSYYSLINEKLKTENIILEGILTSNYFKHVDILDLPDEKVSFLNGKLNLFETPETLEVLDLNKNNIINRKNIYFPFLFGQSYLKPIVSQHQINEFHKMSNILENADILVILGYGLNEDDNHINSYFREFAKEGKQIFYVSNSDKDFYKYLKLENNDNFKNIIVDFKLHKEEAKTNAAIVDQIFTEINNL